MSLASKIRKFVGVSFAAAVASTVHGAPLGTAFTYQGTLKQSSVPVSATADFQFSLWDAATGGTQAGSTINVNNVAVSGGQFAVNLDFGAASLNGNDRFLQIAVRSPAGSGSFTTLTTRQPLKAAPYAIQTRGIFVDSSNRVGIGTTAPTELLHVSGGDLLLDRGTAVSTLTRSITLGGARDINTADIATIDFTNYDLADSQADYVAARISARNDGSDDGDIRFSTTLDTVLTQQMVITSAGNVGIGVNAPTNKLQVNGSAQTTSLNVTSDIAVGGGIRRGGAAPATGDLGLYSLNSGNWLRLVANNGPIQFFTNSTQGTSGSPAANSSAMTISASGAVGIGTSNPVAKLDVAGTARADIIEIDAGADVAEKYDVAAAPSRKDVQPQPGMVVSIDPAHIGKLAVSDSAYDRRVAGVISGAGDVRPGLVLAQPGTAADGAFPVANLGRVWCLVDADAGGPVEAGDMLTTSSTPGHAMRAADDSRIPGATIGKAMSPLKSGRGLVLVLVSLQ